MKYLVGNKVEIRNDLVINEIYGDAIFTSEMVQFLGQEAVIDELLIDTYSLDIDINHEFEFSEEMFCK